MLPVATRVASGVEGAQEQTHRNPHNSPNGPQLSARGLFDSKTLRKAPHVSGDSVLWSGSSGHTRRAQNAVQGSPGPLELKWSVSLRFHVFSSGLTASELAIS